MPNDITRQASAGMTFSGFEPTFELRSLAKELLWYIEGRSPSQSFASASLSKAERSYHGTLEISSNQGTFVAEASSKNAEDCLQDLYRRALSLIKDWSLSRELPEAL